MKTAISIPDDVFNQAERLARKSRKSRSELFSDAMREYVARHAPDDVTDAMNRVCAHVGKQRMSLSQPAARRNPQRPRVVISPW